MFKKEGLDAVILSHNIDSPFITQMEQKNEHIKFQRIDADLTDHFKEDVSEEEKEARAQGVQGAHTLCAPGRVDV